MPQVEKQQDEARGTLITYSVGFALSVVLTLSAYFLTSNHVSSGHEKFTHQSLIIGLLCLALVQFFVQAVFFLHLTRESKPRWNLTVFAFMMIVVGIVVGGSLWIMHSLNYQHVHPKSQEETNTYIIEDELLQTPKNEHDTNSHSH